MSELLSRLPLAVTCDQCILQWSYIGGNNWGTCANGTSGLGCGDQETFRSCADIRILPHPLLSGLSQLTQSTLLSDQDDLSIDYVEDLTASPFASLEQKEALLRKKKIILQV